MYTFTTSCHMTITWPLSYHRHTCTSHQSLPLFTYSSLPLFTFFLHLLSPLPLSLIHSLPPLSLLLALSFFLFISLSLSPQTQLHHIACHQMKGFNQCLLFILACSGVATVGPRWACAPPSLHSAPPHSHKCPLKIAVVLQSITAHT